MMEMRVFNSYLKNMNLFFIDVYCFYLKMIVEVILRTMNDY